MFILKNFVIQMIVYQLLEEIISSKSFPYIIKSQTKVTSHSKQKIIYNEIVLI
jgi:hypothetical protein